MSCEGGEMQPTEHEHVERKKMVSKCGEKRKRKAVKEEKKKLVPGCFFDTWPACVSYFSM